jgi:hypothetical protein
MPQAFTFKTSSPLSATGLFLSSSASGWLAPAKTTAFIIDSPLMK